MVPVKVELVNSELFLTWNDNKVSSIKLVNLRNLCPCAVCIKEHEEQGEGYIPLYSKDQLTIIEIVPSGNYALNITWKDGHNIGFYEFNYLREISNTIKEK
ncbi:MAG: DUF971 domain-containing protein [Melioribacteraceae bacterium]|nr:DUF971 domain-containing protein [Melioribacteraceae bacterium]